MMKTNIIYQGDCLEVMKTFPDDCIDMCMTSPPYWGLRDYGTGKGQLGLEPTPELYIKHMTTILREVKRVLKKEGTLWLNIGDTYGGSGGHGGNTGFNTKKYADALIEQGKKQKRRANMPKCLCMIPERLAWTMIQNGWILRNKIIWYKPNAMPESVKDRLSNKYESIYLFSKNKHYYFDLDSIREPHIWGGIDKRADGKMHKSKGKCESGNYAINGVCYNEKGKNPGDIWIINTRATPEAHFAVFPEKLCEKPIKAGCPEGGVFLDFFSGIGTALFVAKELRRKYIGIELNPEYIKIAERGLSQEVLTFPS